MNPIDYLFGKRDDEFDTWEGQFGCSERGCYEVTHIATYDPETKVLMFKCPAGHKNVLENM